jgi:hypothetical protein
VLEGGKRLLVLFTREKLTDRGGAADNLGCKCCVHHSMRFAMLMMNSLTDVVVILGLLPLFFGLAQVAYGGEQ